MLNVLNVRRVSVIQTGNGRRKAEMLTSGLVEATVGCLTLPSLNASSLEVPTTHTRQRVFRSVSPGDQWDA